MTKPKQSLIYVNLTLIKVIWEEAASH